MDRRDSYLIAREQEEACQKVREEIVEWVEHNLIYIALEYDGTPVLHLQTSGKKSAEKWQAQLKEWGVDDWNDTEYQAKLKE